MTMAMPPGIGSSALGSMNEEGLHMGAVIWCDIIGVDPKSGKHAGPKQ